MKFWTGANNRRKSLVNSTGMPVDDAGAATATVVTTMQGMNRTAFQREYLKMYYAPTENRQATSDSPWGADEWGRGANEAGVPIPTDKQLLWLFFGGDFHETTDTDVSEPGNKIKKLNFGLYSVGNATASDAFALNTPNETTIQLVGQYPENDIEFTLNTAAIEEAAAMAGFKIVGSVKLVLPKDVQFMETQIEVEYV